MSVHLSCLDFTSLIQCFNNNNSSDYTLNILILSHIYIHMSAIMSHIFMYSNTNLMTEQSSEAAHA